MFAECFDRSGAAGKMPVALMLIGIAPRGSQKSDFGSADVQSPAETASDVAPSLVDPSGTPASAPPVPPPTPPAPPGPLVVEPALPVPAPPPPDAVAPLDPAEAVA